MRIDGIEIKNYRSFDGNGIKLEDFGNINVFIGKNNSGKSNVLRFISSLYYLTSNDSNAYNLIAEDHYEINEEKTISFSIKYDKNKTLNYLLKNPINIDDELRQVDSIWISYAPKNENNNKYDIDIDNNLKWFSPIIPRTASKIKEFARLTGQPTHNLASIIAHLFIETIKKKRLIENKVYLIENYRKIDKPNDKQLSPKGDSSAEARYYKAYFNGSHLIEELNRLKNPLAKNQTEKGKFRKIETFIKDILEMPQATIEINSTGDELSIENKGRQIPLENLGTGIHQLLILAIAVTIFEDCIFCIEEPEIFLHTEIQKKFMNYLLKTKNQYFITTHSNSFINIEGLDIYHVTNDGVKSNVSKVINSENKNHILDDLGYQASDILQSNYIVWVEGPSDRIYLNYWIKKVDESLIEGVHYSIMFYGGKLRAHLTIDENSVNDFIELSKINRNAGIIQDSDKKSEDDSIDNTKQRLIKEFNDAKQFNWLTTGKEIENYIPKDIITKSREEIVDDADAKFKYGQFEKLPSYKLNGVEKKINKIDLARLIISKEPAIEGELQKKVEELISFINKANNK